MKPKPLDPPFDLSITTFAELTGPYTANAARRSSCVTSNDRLPTNSFVIVMLSLSPHPRGSPHPSKAAHRHPGRGEKACIVVGIIDAVSGTAGMYIPRVTLNTY